MAIGIGKKMFSILVMLLLSFFNAKAIDLALKSGSSFALGYTTSLENYIIQNDRQYAAQVSSYENQMTVFRADYRRQLDTVNYNKDLLLVNIAEVNQKLYPLEFLNEHTKLCVQKYSSLLFTESAVRSSFENCINSASSALNSILSTPQNTYRLLNNYYNGNWKNGLTNCDRNNNSSYTNHTICVTNLVRTTNSYFNQNQRSFTTQLDASRCSADSRIKTTAECVFPSINNTLSTIGAVNRLVDDCIAGIEVCSQCQNNFDNTTAIYGQPECPNVINIIPDSQIYQNATIRNPFYGMSTAMECLLIHFNQPA